MSEAIYTQEQLIRARNENYAAGVQDERNRIVKLLTENPLTPLVWRENSDNSILMPKADFIAFIVDSAEG